MDKSPDAFRTISEVADDLDLPQHVLRFWETRFSQIRPLKRGGGRRYYRPDDVDLLKGIRHLLYGEGYTIKGVQRILKEEGVRFVQSVGRGEQSVGAPPSGAGEGAEDLQLPPGEDDTGGLDEEAPNPPSLSSDDALRLRGALEELLECDRVLASLKAPNEA
jgi:DNA-binding transcriptional MerR regulator